MLECTRGEIDHRSLLYRYKDENFSIMPYLTGGMTDSEYRTLVKAIEKFKDSITAYEELRFAVLSRVESDYEKGPIYVEYEDNRRLKGREYRPLFYRAITEKKGLHICYRKYNGVELEYDFHPYLLKQYNERWFAFGRRKDNRDPYTAIPLDRIESVKEVDTFPEKRPDNYTDYFKQRVGVSRQKGERVHHITVRITDVDAWGRVTSKPLPTQNTKIEFDPQKRFGEICLDIIPNPEFYTKVLSLGEGIEILSDEEVRSQFVALIKSISRKYPEITNA